MEEKKYAWIEWMKSHIGELEHTGWPATPFDKEVFLHTTYGPLADGIMQPGCAATACAALEESGLASPHNAAAESFAEFGSSCALVPGAIVVFKWPGGGHHVTFCERVIDIDRVACLGGNQQSMIKVSIFSRKFILAVRWPDAGAD